MHRSMLACKRDALRFFFRRVPITFAHVRLSTRLAECISTALAGRIFTKFNTVDSYKNR